MLFGPLAKHTAVRARPLPDGTYPLRGIYLGDPRDPDDLRLAGKLHRVLYRVRLEHHGGDTMAAMLEAYYSRPTILDQRKRLDAAIAALQKNGVRLCIRRGKDGTALLYRQLLEQGYAAFAAELRKISAPH